VRVILDTNILISALIRRDGVPGRILQAWVDGRYDLLTHERQLDELRLVTRRPEFRELIRPAQAGRMVNQLRLHAEIIARIPRTRRSDDPADDFLLAMCETSFADYLATGDKAGLLNLKSHGRTAIVTARFFLDLIS
jgi:uncharacterized protein